MSHPLLHRLSKVLFFLLILTLPWNLFLKFITPSAYVSGVLVDYLIPKLYISDLVLLALGAVLLLIHAPNFVSLHRVKPRPTLRFSWGLLALGLFACIHLAVHPTLPTAFFLLKMIELGIFGSILFHHKSFFSVRLIQLSIVWSMLVQLGLATYQWIFQHAFLPYQILGEPQFGINPLLSRTDTSGPLSILPYGTTPHPNILAGLLVMGLCCLVWLKMEKKVLLSLAVWMLYILVIIQSFTAWACLGTAIFAILAVRKGLARKLRSKWLGILFCIVVAVSTPFILRALPTTLGLQPANQFSYSRRVQLNSAAVQMFVLNPAFGVGLNMYPTQVEQFVTVAGTLRFLQPAHHIGLLWLAETGMFGILFMLILAVSVHKRYSLNMPVFLIISCAGMWIFSLDHYLLTLQQGQLASMLLIVSCLVGRKK